MPEYPDEPGQQFETEVAPLNPPDSETLPGVAEQLAAWHTIANKPPTSLGYGVVWRPGQSVNAFWRDASRFVASIAAQEAHENPDDPEAQERYAFWLEQVKKFSGETE